MRVAFRADASVALGSGHVMRCLTLADALREQGAETCFFCRLEPGHLGEQIEGRGHRLVWLREPCDQYDDARTTLAAMAAEEPWDWLVVDHYGLDAAWERRLRGVARRVMVIDDLADRPHDCDLLLDQNLYRNAESRYDGLLPALCERLLGPHYALLRPQFGQARHQMGRRDGRLATVLICFGGSDPDNWTALALDAFVAAEMTGVVAEVVVGAGNPHLPALQTCYGSRPNLNLRHAVSNMAEFMMRADLFLGSGGTLTWERAALGLPGVTLAIADNQRQLCMDLAEAGAGMHLGDAHAARIPDIAAVLQVLNRQPALLRGMSQRLMALTDGLGAARVLARLMPPEIALRPVQSLDCEQLFAWRNHPLTRCHFFDSSPLELDAHRAWLAAAMQNDACVLLIASCQGADVGVLRYDLDGAEAVVSIYLDPMRQGQGLGAALLKAGAAWLGHRRPEIRQIVGDVLKGNAASQRAFIKAGFREIFSRYQIDVTGQHSGVKEQGC